MKHQRNIAKFRGTSSRRDAMLKNMAASLIQYEEIKTTEAKAKAVTPYIEHLITIAKKGTSASVRRLESLLPTKLAVEKLTEVLAGRYEDRDGGFITKVRLPKRSGDSTRMVKIKLMEDLSKSKKEKKAKK